MQNVTKNHTSEKKRISRRTRTKAKIKLVKKKKEKKHDFVIDCDDSMREN